MQKIFLVFFDEAEFGNNENQKNAFVVDLVCEIESLGLKRQMSKNVIEFEKNLREKDFSVIFMGIRVSAEGYKEIDGYPCERAGIALIKRIHSNYYERNQSVPIVVITSIADYEAQKEIFSLRNGGYYLYFSELPSSMSDIIQIAEFYIEKTQPG